MSIDELNVSDRIKRALKSGWSWCGAPGVETVEHLCVCSSAEIDRLPDLGKVGQKQLLRAVQQAGFAGFGMTRVRVKMGRAVV